MTLHREAPPAHGTSMTAAILDGPRAPLRVGAAPRPERLMSEVLVRVVAAGLDPVDVAAAQGALPVPQWPAVLGCDFSGVVEESPFEAFGLQPGDEVYGISAFPRVGGSLAGWVAVPPSNVALKPRVLSHAEAAAIPVAALTAWGAVVELAKAHEGQRVLVHAGDGGVGHVAVQIARYFGAEVTATASAVNARWLRDLGAERVVAPRAETLADAVGEVDVVIDLAGDGRDRLGPRSLGLLRHGGLLVSAPDTAWPSLSADAAAAGVRGTLCRTVPDPATLAVVARLVTSGDLRVEVQQVLPLERVADAVALLADGRVRGRLVVQVADW